MIHKLALIFLAWFAAAPAVLAQPAGKTGAPTADLSTAGGGREPGNVAAGIPSVEKLAVIEIKTARYVSVGKMRENAYINTNRAYLYRSVPKPMAGLHYTKTDHKAPATLTCTALEAGMVLAASGDGAVQDPSEGGLSWSLVGQMTGTDASVVRKWLIWGAAVSKGDTFVLTPKNKWGTTLVARRISTPGAGARPQDAGEEYSYLKGLLKKRLDTPRYNRVQAQSMNAQAMILTSDRDPLDVVLRRTEALIDDLLAMPLPPDLAAARAQFAKLKGSAATTDPGDENSRRQLFDSVCAVRRGIAFANPLLDFSELVFLTHRKSRMVSGSNHMCDQYFGFNAIPDGSLYVLDDPFGKQPEVRDVLKDARVQNGRLQGRTLEGGSFISLELSYDARKLYFAWTEADPAIRQWRPESCYHLFSVNLDGSELTQLSDGSWNDFDPCELPDGRICFISERRGGFGRCHGRPVPTYTLHSMNPDGSDIQALSYHETNEWHPSVDRHGMIAFTRWDYVDRDSDVAHHLWLCFPDGRDARSYHGNYPLDRHARPWMEMSIRAVPQSHLYLAVAAPHHGQAYGSLVMIDQRPEDDGLMSQVLRFTPETPFPESERGPLLYGTPWPLNDTYSLCVFDWRGQHYGIYLIDAFGNRELLYADPETPALDPIPLRPRPRPPIIPTFREGKGAGTASGTVAVMNVYEADFNWPAGSQIKELRVIQLFPKTTPNANQPNIGAGNQSLARGVLGTVPVEADGSAHFELPANVSVYFQALDERGIMVQNMRSNTFVGPGEQLTCLGCHEPKRSAGPVSRTAMPTAVSRSPSKITPEAEGAYPLTFPRLVQPVLDRHCVSCHAKEAKAPDLSGEKLVGNGWSQSFGVLRRHAWARHGGNGSIKRNEGSRSIPGRCGARGSKLFKMLEAGHKGVKLPPQDLRCIAMWLDCNSNFYGAYTETEKQARGEKIMPTLF